MKNLLEIYKALSDQTRLRALAAVEHNELCLCQLTGLLGLAPSTVSKHMSLLSRAGLVQSRKDGRWVYYSLAPKSDKGIWEHLKPIMADLGNYPVVAADRRKLKEILKIDPEILCKVPTK